MIRTFALVFALVAVLGAIGYAQNMRGIEPLNFRNPRTLAGQVNADGSVARGSHFTVTRIAEGEYELNFDSRYFPGGCPILTVAAVELPATSYLKQEACRTYFAYFNSIPGGRGRDTAFDLIAVAAE